MSEPLSYTVTPGPDLRKRMGQSWILSLNDSPAATFTHGPKGEPPGSVTLTLSVEQAAQLKADGYEVKAKKGRASAASESEDGDSGPGIDPLGPPEPKKT